MSTITDVANNMEEIKVAASLSSMLRLLTITN